jgi:hypothetical protein
MSQSLLNGRIAPFGTQDSAWHQLLSHERIEQESVRIFAEDIAKVNRILVVFGLTS